MISRGRASDSSNHSKLEKLHEQAKAILEQKAKEISEFQSAIEQAEAELSTLQAELASQNKRTEDMLSQDVPMSERFANRDQIDSIRAEHQAEIERIEEKHQREVQRLQKEMKMSLEAAEDWAEKHAEMVYHSKRAQLDDLRRKVDEAKAASHQSSFAAVQQRTQLFQQSKNASLMNSQRLQFLESQVSEVATFRLIIER
jgi:predicted phage tail protein